MRKNYLISGIVFCLATLILFASFAVLYTRAKIDDINEDIYELVLTINNYTVYHFEDCEEEQTKADLTYTIERYFSNELTQGSGIYSSVIEHESGRIVAASADLTAEGDLTDPVLNAEAQKISEEYTKNYDPAVNEYGLHESEEGITRTTFMRIDNFRDGRYLLTHCAVYTPLKTVLKDNAATYITGLIIFLILEATILISFINLYKSRKEFELRNIKLTRGIAHELKTPLAVTKATVENWEYLSEEQKEEYAGNVKAEADHMTDLVDKLLEVSRIRGSESDLKREAVNLLAVTKVLRDRYSELIRERDIDMKIMADEDSYTVFADPDMMEIVIGNYLSNAIKYCDKKITIRLTRSGKKISFIITNDGAKIDKKDLNKIWDVFYTTDDSRSGRINNSGVGLSVVKSILEAHKAEYGCVSNASGTSFSFVMDRHEK